MIMIKGAVGKKEYKEPFSKGIMARSLYITDLGHDEAYEIASCIENKLLEENISEISIEDLAIFVTNYLKNYVDPVLAEKAARMAEQRFTVESKVDMHDVERHHDFIELVVERFKRAVDQSIIQHGRDGLHASGYLILYAVIETQR